MTKNRGELARKVRHHISLNRTAALSTISVSQAGFPFGSLAPYDVSDAGEIVIYVSLIAEHYKNLSSDSRASLFVMDPFGVRDPQSHARATVLARFEEVPNSERNTLQERYEARFPGSINYEIAHNFVFMKGKPEKVRWIGGFGEISWVSGTEFCAAEKDPISYIGHSILEHMNDDHHDALVTIAGEAGRGYTPVMSDVCSSGFTISLFRGGDRKVLEIPFAHPVTDAEGARREVIAVLKRARGD